MRSPIPAHSRQVADDVRAIQIMAVAKATDGVRHHGGRQWVLHGCCVDDADDVPRARRLEDGEKGAGAAALRVELDDLLVVVGALERSQGGRREMRGRREGDEREMRGR